MLISWAEVPYTIVGTGEKLASLQLPGCSTGMMVLWAGGQSYRRGRHRHLSHAATMLDEIDGPQHHHVMSPELFLGVETELSNPIRGCPGDSWHRLPPACLCFKVSAAFSSKQQRCYLLPARDTFNHGLLGPMLWFSSPGGHRLKE